MDTPQECNWLILFQRLELLNLDDLVQVLDQYFDLFSGVPQDQYGPLISSSPNLGDPDANTALSAPEGGREALFLGRCS